MSGVDIITPFDLDGYMGLGSAPTVGQTGDFNCVVPSLAAKASYTCTGSVT